MVNYDDLNSDIYIALDDVMDKYLRRYDIYDGETLQSDNYDDLITAVSDEIHKMLIDRIKREFNK